MLANNVGVAFEDNTLGLHLFVDDGNEVLGNRGLIRLNATALWAPVVVSEMLPPAINASQECAPLLAHGWVVEHCLANTTCHGVPLLKSAVLLGDLEEPKLLVRSESVEYRSAVLAPQGRGNWQAMLGPHR